MVQFGSACLILSSSLGSLGLVVRADGVLDVSEFGLDLIRVYDPGEIGAGHDRTGESVSLLLVRWGSISSEDRVELIKSILGEDGESTEVTTWSQLEDVKSVNIASLNSWQVSGGLLHILGGISVDNKWSLSHDVSRVSVFSNTGSDFLGSLDLQEFVGNTEFVQSGEEIAGGFLFTNSGVEDEWELWDIVNVVTSGHDERGACGGSEG